MRYCLSRHSVYAHVRGCSVCVCECLRTEPIIVKCVYVHLYIHFKYRGRMMMSRTCVAASTDDAAERKQIYSIHTSIRIACRRGRSLRVIMVGGTRNYENIIVKQNIVCKMD